MANSTLHRASKAKNDEFYTQLSDIENELIHYTKHFVGKTILCNCDDPRISNFFRYFALNFQRLGLKRLIATCYMNDNPDLFSQGTSVNHSIYSDFDGSFECNELTDFNRIPYKQLNGDGTYSAGDFRSCECIDLLKQADVVVTNPPFSLFREYVAQLIKYDKKFVIIGNQNAITYKEVFPLIKQNKIWLGYGFRGGNAYFGVKSDGVREYAQGVYDIATGLVKFRNCCWFTNLDHDKRHEELILYKNYNPKEYPKYDNYDAINVDKVADIPCDYYGVMGVPITFLDKYNPEQFEIVEFRRGADGKDLVYSNLAGGAKRSLISEYSSVDADRRTDEQSERYNRERQEQICANSYSTTAIPGMIKNKEGMINGKITYARVLIRRLKI